MPALQYDTALDAKDPSRQYIVKWTCRGYLLSRVRGAGIKRVMADNTTLRTWMRYSGPDSKATFLAAVPRDNLSMDLREFVAMVNYEGPLELWGMYACLFTDPSIRTLSTTWLRDNMKPLAKRRKLYKDEHGQNPVPGFLVQQLFDRILFYFKFDHGAFDDDVLLLIFRLFYYFSVGPTICYRAVYFLWIAFGASFKNLSTLYGDQLPLGAPWAISIPS